MEWLVQIEGDQFVLQELSKSFNSPELCIFKDGQKYFLKYSEFNTLSNAEDVFHKAKIFVPILSGAAKLELCQHVRLGNIFRKNDDGTLEEFSFGWFSGEYPAAFLRAAEKGVQVSNLADKVPIWIKVAQKDNKATEALTLFGTDNIDWGVLYKIYEIIRDDFGGEQIFREKQRISKERLNRFTQIAQPYRHAKNSETIKNWKSHENPLSFSEAKSFIKNILDNWLRIKEQSKKDI